MSENEELFDNQDNIRKYINDELDSEERSIFERQLNSSKSLQAELKFYKDIREVLIIRNKEELRKKLKRVDKDKNIKPDLTTTWSNKNIRNLGGVFFAILILSFLLFYFIRNNQNNRQQQIALIVENMQEPYENLVGYDSSANDNLSKGMEAYDSRNYEDAIKYLSESLQEEDIAEVKFYLGISYLFDENPKEAIKVFNKINQDSFVLRKQLQWYLALSYLDVNEEEKAISILEVLSNDAEFGEAATLIIEELESL